MKLITGGILLGTCFFGGCGNTNISEKSQPDTGVIDSGNIVLVAEKVEILYDTVSCDFSEWLWEFDSVPSAKQLKKEIANNVSLEYLEGNAGFLNFQKIKARIRNNQVLARQLQLPSTALILEKKQLPGIDSRAYILWVEDARVGFEFDEVYTCPQVTMGTGYFIGKTRVSLINTKSSSIINTISVFPLSWFDGVLDCFIIPYSIANPTYRYEIGRLKYHAIGGDTVKDGIAEVLFLDDFTGDGKKLEFALYEQDGCVSCATTLFGYDITNDKVINYVVELNETDLDSADKGSISTESVWVDHMFTFRPKKGVYKFTMDYRGRGGQICDYLVGFNKEKNVFAGTLKLSSNDSLGYGWISYPEQKN